MLIPSYAELMDVLNKESEECDVITSRYTIVIAAAKRARQIIEGDEPMVDGKKSKPVSTAVEEILQNKIKIVPEGEGTVLVLKKDLEEQERNRKREEELRLERELEELDNLEEIQGLESLDELESLDDLDDLEDIEDLDEVESELIKNIFEDLEPSEEIEDVSEDIE